MRRVQALTGVFALLSTAVSMATVVVSSAPVRALVDTTIVVTTTADTDNGSNSCLSGPAVLGCSLREALKAATQNGDTIQLQAGALYTLELGELEHGDSGLTIQGAGATIDAQGKSRVLKQGSLGLTIFDLTLTNGYVSSVFPESGGAIEADGLLNLVGTTVSNSTVNSDGFDTHGGAVYAGGSLSLLDSQISGSTAAGSDGLAVAQGGCAYSKGPAFVQDSVLVGCTAAAKGGGEGGALFGDSTVTVSGSTIASSSAPDEGGGIFATSSLSISGSTISASTASAGVGGGAFTKGTATVVGSTFAGNSALGDGVNQGGAGGGAYALGAMTVTDSTFTGNLALGGQEDAPAQGGGAWTNADITISGSAFLSNIAAGTGKNSSEGGAVFATGTADVSNTTFADNAAQTDDDVDGGSSGGALNAGSADLRFVTLSGNAASVGAQVRTTGTLRAAASVLASPGGGGSDCAVAAAESAGHNMGDGSCGFTAAHDVVDGSDPMLAAPADHGGPTATMLPLPGSPLVDAIPAASCTGCATVDQRGVARPQGSGYDIGAVEVISSVAVSPRFTG